MFLSPQEERRRRRRRFRELGRRPTARAGGVGRFHRLLRPGARRHERSSRRDAAREDRPRAHGQRLGPCVSVDIPRDRQGIHRRGVDLGEAFVVPRGA